MALAAEPVLEQGHLAEDAGRVLEQRPAVGAELQAAAVALEQHAPEPLLEIPKPKAHGRLREVELARRCPDGAESGRPEERRQLGEGDAHRFGIPIEYA